MDFFSRKNNSLSKENAHDSKRKRGEITQMYRSENDPGYGFRKYNSKSVLTHRCKLLGSK